MLCGFFYGLVFKCNFKILFIFRKMGREGEREGKQHQCVRETSIGSSCVPLTGEPGLQPRHVP